MRIIVSLVISAVALFALPPAASAQFSPNPITTTVTTPQTLTGSTGTINAGGAISLPLASAAVALTMNGVSTLTNNGTIQTAGTGRAIDNTANASTLVITNNGSILAVSTDAVHTANAAISLTNSGIIDVSAGGQAIDWANITTKTSTLTNQLGGSITARGEDAVRPGTNTTVNNAGTIRATPTVSAGVATGSDGIQAGGSGVVVTNTGTIEGRHGITGGVAGFSITVNNNAGTIQAVNGSGINIDDLGSNVNVTNLVGATIRGGVLELATAGDGDGVDVDGVVTLMNSGDILGYGAKGLGSDGGPNNSEGVSIGGGSITNNATGQIIGSTALADAPNGDTSRAGNGILADNSSGGAAIAATSVINSGLIQGKTGFGVKFIGNLADTITNNASGTIRGAGSVPVSGAAIQTGDGIDTVTNRGAIIGDNGKALDLEGGDDILNVEGGSASIVGDVSGGTGTNALTFALGGGNAFNYANVLSLFGTVDVKSGLVTLSGANTYIGTTQIEATAKLLLDGVNRLNPLSSLTLDGGMLEIANGLGVSGQTFSSFALSDSSTIDLDFSSLTLTDLGPITPGKTLTILDYLDTSSYAFRVAGNTTTDADFLALMSATTIGGLAPKFYFDSATGFTNVQSSVPEPATLILVGIGGAVLVWRRERNRQAR